MFCIGKGYLVLNTRCSGVWFLGRNIVNDNICGIDFRLGDLGFGVLKSMWKTHGEVGFCYGNGVWKSIGVFKADLMVCF